MRPSTPCNCRNLSTDTLLCTAWQRIRKGCPPSRVLRGPNFRQDGCNPRRLGRRTSIEQPRMLVNILASFAANEREVMTRKNGTIRYAVIGLGHIAQVAVLPAFAHARKNSTLTAVVSDDPTKRKEIAKKYKLGKTYSYAEYDQKEVTQ